MPITRIGAVYLRKDNQHVWVVESLWWMGGKLDKITVIDVSATPPVRNEITPDELTTWIKENLLELATIVTGRQLWKDKDKIRKLETQYATTTNNNDAELSSPD